MKSIAKFGLVLLAFCLQIAFLAQLRAQDAIPLFKHFTTEEGLPSSEVYSSLQDKNGNMWFGTDRGVVRYDGYGFKTFTTQDGLTDNTVFFLCLDARGRLWMYTFSGRIFYLEGEKILPFKYNELLLNNSINKLPNGFYVDSLGNVIVALRGNGTISIDKQGKFNRIDSVSYRLDSCYYINEFPGNHSVLSILGVNGNSEKALVNHRFGNVKKQYEVKTREFGRLCFLRLSENEILFSIGFSVFYVKGNNKVEELYSFPCNVFSLLKDHNKNLWIGTEDGIYFFDKNDWKKYSRIYLKDNMITSISQDNENGFWFTTLESGIYYLPGNDVKSIVFSDSLKKPTCLATDFKNKIYVGCWTGAIAEITNQKVKIIYELRNEDKKLPINDLTTFPLDETIYVSRYIAGIFKNGKLELFKNANPFGAKTKYVKSATGDIYAAGSCFILEMNSDSILVKFALSQRINSIIETDDGRLLVGCNRGVFYYDEVLRKEVSLNKKFDEVRVDDIKQSGNKLFFATKGSGLMILVGDSVHTIDESKGLASNLVGKITISGNELWVATNKGVSHIVFAGPNINDYKITNIHNSDGLLNDEISEIALLNDTVYIATNSGISFFSAKTGFSNSVAPLISISSIKVNAKAIDNLNNLSFSHDSNNVHVSFNAISFKSFGKITYRYMLVHDKDTISSTTMNREVDFLSLAPGNYHFNVMAMNKAGQWSVEKAGFDFVIKPAWWQTILFKVLMALFITFLIFVYYRFQLSKLKKEMETERVKASLELTAIRAQMNPHFIFNVMNSIRIFMQNHDLKSAEKYLTKFSKQVRYVLDNSDKQIVSLENELNSLRNYVELEMQQFENGFEFKIDCEPGVDVSDYELPSLLLQPFVENSIKHGIARMECGGKIHINIRKKGENLLISIEDNGIGMKEAIEWNEAHREPHESRGTKIIFQRIEAYNKFFRKNIRAEIHDLHTETGNKSGTRVEIEI